MHQTNSWTRFSSLIVGIWIACILPAITQAQGSNNTEHNQLVSAENIVRLNAKAPRLRSSAALVMDQREGVVLYGRNIQKQQPIASVTKLMTAITTLDQNLPMDEVIEITSEDRDRLRGSGSRLPFKTKLTRNDLLLTALAASDNRAASALARSFPGGREAMIRAMNEKAQQLGMTHTHYSDSSGLNNGNVSTASDLALLVDAAAKYPKIEEFTTTGKFSVTDHRNGKNISFRNTNRLVSSSAWDINLSKTGFTNDAGNCLVMNAIIGQRPVIIVLLNSWGKQSKYADSRRIREWLLRNEHRALQLSDAGNLIQVTH